MAAAVYIGDGFAPRTRRSAVGVSAVVALGSGAAAWAGVAPAWPPVAVAVVAAAALVRAVLTRATTVRAVQLASRITPTGAGGAAQALAALLRDPDLTVDDPGAGAAEPRQHHVVVCAEDGREIAVVGFSRRPRRHDLVDAVLLAARPALENDRLFAAHGRELARAESVRRRIAQTAMEERHRVERALHDGAQQSLLSLALQTEAIGATAVDPSVETALRGAAEEFRRAHAAVRRIAGSVFPPLLDGAGPAAALDALGERLAIDLRVHQSDGRCDRVAEAVAYFAVADVLSALTRASRTAVVDVRFTVCPDVLRVLLSHASSAEQPDDGVRTLVEDRLAAFDGRAGFAVGADGVARLTLEIPCRSA